MNNAARCAAVLAAGVLPLAGLAAPAVASAAAPAGSTAILTAPGEGSAVLERMRRDVAAVTGASDVQCWRDLTIKSSANGKFVSADIGAEGEDNGMLRARATVAGRAEKFIVCRDGDSGVTNLRAQANNDYVSAELDYAGAKYATLRARADEVGGWEQYYSNNEPGGQFSFYAKDTKRWVSAEVTFAGAYYGVLRARATKVGAPETFVW